MYTNGYIFRYAAIMVIIAAAVLSTAAMFLKPFQEKNMAIEKMGGILISANIEGIETENTIEMFNQYVVEELVVDQDGKIVESFTEGKKETAKAFGLNLKTQLYKKSQGENFELPIYIIEKDGEKTYVFPLRGVGLWGPVWGNMALGSDFNTIKGVTFDHKGETPGLGAEISTSAFEEQFKGKKIFDENGNFKSIKVVKGGAQTLPANQQIHGVDAISGGTITSVGVNDMIDNVLQGYLPYIQKEK
ncbi:MAG: NADH:ubiquinone reductase (Na(+)-transporting) subunit C [Marinilabiliales bacterium]|nr:MAG: NADH:ubiquinone reductase (Na(+)-transporting) subunit C [Marinilabiliales bacterium]